MPEGQGNCFGLGFSGSSGTSGGQFGQLLAPVVEATFQGVDLGHVVADSSQSIGGSLCITLAGVADQNQLLVQAFGSLLHGSLASFSVAFLGSVHVPSLCARDGVSGRVSSLTDVKEDVLVIANQSLSFVSGDVLHSNVSGLVLSRSSSIAATSNQGEDHHDSQQQREQFFHCVFLHFSFL